MAEIKNIDTASIDPESRVNVRRTLTEESVEKVKASIAEHGFWENNPIIVRPHPGPSSDFKYEVIVGGRRLRACLDLGRKEIPAVVQEIDDDQAIRLSWAENEARDNLTSDDKSHWVTEFVENQYKAGRGIKLAQKDAAKYFAMPLHKVAMYYNVSLLPLELRDMVGKDKPLNIKEAEAISKSAKRLNDLEEREQKMKERAEWFVNLPDPAHKEQAITAMEELPERASIDELNTALEEGLGKKEVDREVKVSYPKRLRKNLLEWGRKQGLGGRADEATIICHMIVKTCETM
jgi:ParB/RepB/Spo0J family partition protein